ncbi:MAG: galactokinase [Flavisolibacter sp.]|jgi:galactokinase|nr:galactokinase [Flavisolibacter sp.]
MNNNLSNNIRQNFRQRFATEPLIARSPGRVNIIGEHTDYNNGFVLPAAVDKSIYVGISKRDDDKIVLYSEEFGEEHQSTVSTVEPSGKHWPNYVLGVVDQLNKRGYAISGFNLNVDGDVPVGAGLSSSAAVECAVAFALNELFSLNIPKIEIPEIGQKTEHTFAGAMVGIMDPFASVFGKKDHVIKLDCQSLDYEYVPLEIEGYKIVLLNTNVKHSLASSEYNTRRKECEAGVAMIVKAGIDVKSLRDVTIEMLRKYVEPADALIYKRCKYVVEENERLLSACEHLKNGNIEGLGKKMYGSHDGLSKEYEVSCPELDFLVDAVRGNPGVLGARMMGGGFGGCTINIVKEEAIDELVENLSKTYKQAMAKELTAYVAQTADGSSIVA